MIKIYLSVFMLAVCKISYGQISLDATMAPQVNTMIIYHDANQPSPPFSFSKSGTANTWDFTSLTVFPGSEDTVFYFPPSNFPPYAGLAFPTATHATYEGGDESVTMLKVDANSVTFLGAIGDPLNTGMQMPLVTNPPAAAMTFPWTYGSSTNVNTAIEIYTTGAAIGQPAIDSVHFKNSVHLITDVIASGDLVLPSGTMASLLERRITTSIDSGWIKSALTGNVWMTAPNTPTTSTDSAFYWYTDQSLNHYAHALYDETGVQHDVHFFASQMTTGISTPENAKQLNVFPNPTNDFLGVSGLNFPSQSKWKIYNLSGQEIGAGTSSLNSLDVKNLSKGTYILHLVTPTGEIHDVRFVKN